MRAQGIDHFETSAKEDKNVQEAFQKIATMALENEQEYVRMHTNMCVCRMWYGVVVSSDSLTRTRVQL